MSAGELGRDGGLAASRRLMPAPAGPRDRASRARWGCHGLLLILALVLLGAFSVPGVDALPFLAATAALGVAALVWCAWAVRAAWRRTWSWWLLVAPIGGLLVSALVVADVPLHARWAASRGAFEAQVRNLPPEPAPDADWVPLDLPSRVGLYDVPQAYRVHGGVLFYEAHGALSDDAGFAYLPDGPTPALEHGDLERPEFTRLGGPWYRWTASW